MASEVHYFGIRHHGPGCAKQLREALVQLQPDCVLVEGPSEGTEYLPFLSDPAIQPPVALLVYQTDQPSHAAFFPFAEFSPEWQALIFAIHRQIVVQFIDLPQSIQLGMKDSALIDQTPDEEQAQAASEHDTICHDPMGWMAQAAGFEDGESWWNHCIEERMDASDLFQAINEMMHDLRRDHVSSSSDFELKREALREAHMRQSIRDAQKAGYQRIAVVCGAWHVPALLDKTQTMKADRALLKGLVKVKTSATWVPWTYRHLAAASGYRAGIEAPGWYEHLWRYESTQRSAAWLARISQLFRSHGIECSAAQVIDAVRMSDTLAAFRGHAIPDVNTLNDAVVSTVCMGDTTPLQLIHRELMVSDKLGCVPQNVPMVALQKDLEQQQKSLRLKPEALEKTLDLDLRESIGLERSHVLHRLCLLGIAWGQPERSGYHSANKGSFHEYWRLQWKPIFPLLLIEANRWGCTLEQAAMACALHKAKHASRLSELTALLDVALLASIEPALSGIMQALGNMAAMTGDITQLLEAVPPLAHIQRYGGVRQIKTDSLTSLLEQLVTRICIGLNAACYALNDDAVSDMRKHIIAFDQAIAVFEHEESQIAWKHTLWELASAIGRVHALLSGTAARLLFDTQSTDNDLILTYMSRALSVGSEPMDAAGWFEGFLHQGGVLLLHDDRLWSAVDRWLMSLSEVHLLHVLPLIRRTFATFHPHECLQLNAKARRGSLVHDAEQLVPIKWNSLRAVKPLAYFQRLFVVEQ